MQESINSNFFVFVSKVIYYTLCSVVGSWSQSQYTVEKIHANTELSILYSY